MYTTHVSDEPLETIRGNEAEAGDGSLATKRFRRLFNEIARLQREAEIAEHYDKALCAITHQLDERVSQRLAVEALESAPERLTEWWRNTAPLT